MTWSIVSWQERCEVKNLEFKPGCYLAFVLSEASRAELMQLCPPAFEKVYCHHVTIDFKINPERFASIKTALGDYPKVEVTGLARNSSIECFTVKINNYPLHIDGGYYHVTHSLTPPAKPVDSNKLLVDLGGRANREFHVDLTGKFEFVR